MVCIFPTCARILNDFGAFWLHSEAVPPPPTPGRARPAWAGLGQQGQAGWLAGWLLARRLALVCVVCCDCVCAPARARACVVCCVLQGSRGTRKEDSQTARSAPLAREARSLARTHVHTRAPRTHARIMICWREGGMLASHPNGK